MYNYNRDFERKADMLKHVPAGFLAGLFLTADPYIYTDNYVFKGGFVVSFVSQC